MKSHNSVENAVMGEIRAPILFYQGQRRSIGTALSLKLGANRKGRVRSKCFIIFVSESFLLDGF